MVSQSIDDKTRLAVVEGNLNAARYRDEIFEPVALPYLQNLGPYAILQDDNARPHRASIIDNFLLLSSWSRPNAVVSSQPRS